MTPENDLRAIWAKYEPQREAERNAAAIQETARHELAELNRRRAAQGLTFVSEYVAQSSVYGGGMVASIGTFPPPKTWRDELDAELLSAVKRYLST